MTNNTTYITPFDVHAPKRAWSLVQVLFDGGAGESSLAIGRWENNPALAMRWNGTKDGPLGNPQSRGLPTWFIVPEQHWKQILGTEQYNFSDQKIIFARDFLELKSAYFLSHCPNPACPDQQRLTLHTFLSSELGNTLKALEQDELKLYHIICDGVWKPRGQEKNDLTAGLQASWDNYRLRSQYKVTARLLENGAIECAWSKIKDGQPYSFVHGAPPHPGGAHPDRPTPIDRIQFERQLKVIGCGASDDQVHMANEQLAQSRYVELWIPQNTSKFLAG